jgi:predicted Zn-dependent protease
MSLLGPDEARRLAEIVLSESKADETEVTVRSELDRFARYAGDGPTQCADRGRVDVAIRVRRAADGSGGKGGWREARATTGGTSPDELAAALARAHALAGKSPANPDAVALGGAVQVRATELDADTASHSFAEKARWIDAAVAGTRAAGFEPAGMARTTSVACGIYTSAGRAVHGVFQRAAFSLTATGPTGSGLAETIRRRAGELDPEAAVERALAKARRAQGPVAFAPGEVTVVLEPNAVSALLLFAGYHGFGAREVVEESSFLCGRIGARAFAPALTIADDAGNDVYPGLPFDGEGTPKERVVLVDAGVLRDPVTDPAYARKLGLPCTGHARPQPSSEGPAATNLVVLPGELATADLVAGVERGLLITQFHYTNVIDPRELVLTGMTRNGTFLIENGEVTRAVRNLRFTESLVRALSRVTGIGREREVAGALFDGEIVAPALRIEGFRFTSSTDF